MRKYSIFRHLCILLFLIFVIPCYGQDNMYNVNMFHSAIRDKAGNLWFATHGAGVYRCDAASGEFTNFTERDGLCGNNVSSILEDKAGNLWFATANGVCRYEGKSFTNITTKESACHYDVNCILEDRNGNFWFGTNGYGVCRYNPPQNDSAGQAIPGAFINFTKHDGLTSNTVQCMLEDKTGNLWFGERAGGVCRYDSASGRFTTVNGEGCLSSQIMSILEDKAGNLWFVNLYSGVCRYDARLNDSVGQGKTFTHFTRENGLCYDTLTCIYEDKKGNLWFGTDTGKSGSGNGGVCRYNPTSGASTYFTTEDGLRHKDVWTIVEDNDGNIWVGSKGGLYRYHSPSGKFIEYTHKVNRQ